MVLTVSMYAESCLKNSSLCKQHNISLHTCLFINSSTLSQCNNYVSVKIWKTVLKTKTKLEADIAWSQDEPNSRRSEAAHQQQLAGRFDYSGWGLDVQTHNPQGGARQQPEGIPTASVSNRLARFSNQSGGGYFSVRLRGT